MMFHLVAGIERNGLVVHHNRNSFVVLIEGTLERGQSVVEKGGYGSASSFVYCDVLV